jgi:hypothetical protein
MQSFSFSLFWEILFFSRMELEWKRNMKTGRSIARDRRELDKDEPAFFTMNFSSLLPYAW